MVTYDISIDGAHAAMPSNYYEELTLSSNSSVTAPADGYIQLISDAATASLNNYCSIRKLKENVPPPSTLGEDTYFCSGTALPERTGGMYCFIPASKDDEIIVNVGPSATVAYIYFIYANGSVPSTPNP